MTGYRWLPVLLIPLAGCNGDAGGPAAAGGAGGPATVKVVRPARQTVRRFIAQPATIEAFEETPLVAKIPGYVERIHGDIGDPVKGPRRDAQGKVTALGQVLAELQAPELVEELRQKQALVAQAQAEVEQAQGALETYEAGILTAQAQTQEAQASRKRALANYQRWEREMHRIEGLVQRKVIDEQISDETRNQFQAAESSRDEVEAKVRSAQAAVAEATARRNKARADVAAAQAHVLVARAEAGRLQALVDYATVRAPFDGVITRRNVNTGHFLQPAAGAGQVLFVIARMDVVRLFLDVPEVDALLVKKDLKATIRVAAIRDRTFEGTVTRSGWSLDPRARTLRTEVDLPNPEGRLRPGMYAYVTLQADLPERLTLPTSAVVTQGDLAFCFQVADGKVRRLPVKLGTQDGAVVEVTKKQGPPPKPGAEGAWEDWTGDEVLVNQPTGLTDGQAVKVEG